LDPAREKVRALVGASDYKLDAWPLPSGVQSESKIKPAP